MLALKADGDFLVGADAQSSVSAGAFLRGRGSKQAAGVMPARGGSPERSAGKLETGVLPTLIGAYAPIPLSPPQ